MELNAERAFRAEKDSFTHPPIFAPPRSDGHIKAETDACDRQLGAVLLLMLEEGQNRLIGFFIGH